MIKFIDAKHRFCNQENSYKRGDSNECPFHATVHSSYIFLPMLLIVLFEHLPSELTRKNGIGFCGKRVRFIVIDSCLGIFCVFVGVSVVEVPVVVTFMNFFDIGPILDLAVDTLKLLSLG